MKSAQQFLAAPETEAELLLNRMFREELLPRLEQMARQTVITPDLVPLVVSDAALGLLNLFRTRRATGEALPRNLDAYLRTTVENAHTSHLRKNFAPFVRFKHRVRFALENTPELRCWQAGGRFLAALADFAERPAIPLDHQRAGITESFRKLTGDGSPENSRALRQVLIEVLKRTGAPVELNELVSALAEIYGFTVPAQIALEDEDRTPLNTVLEGSNYSQIASDRLLGRLDNRDTLARLWNEILLLRPLQRAAVLMNLRDDAGRGVLELLPELGIAALTEIRATLEEAMPLTDARWEELRERMPLTDAEVAVWLATSVETVRGLRRAARERLQRRIPLDNEK